MRIDSPEIAAQHALDPVDVLNRNALIEPVLLADLSITAGSRSSPAMIIAGSPGRSCCSEKISTDTKEQCRMSCTIRLRGR